TLIFRGNCGTRATVIPTRSRAPQALVSRRLARTRAGSLSPHCFLPAFGGKIADGVTGRDTWSEYCGVCGIELESAPASSRGDARFRCFECDAFVACALCAELFHAMGVDGHCITRNEEELSRVEAAGLIMVEHGR